MNLAKQPKEQQEAIEEDKRRWFEANKMYSTMNHSQITQWLRAQKDYALREDMRERLNIIRLNRRSKRAA